MKNRKDLSPILSASMQLEQNSALQHFSGQKVGQQELTCHETVDGNCCTSAALDQNEIPHFALCL